MADGTMANDGRLRDLEAEAFRAARTLAKHSGQLAAIREQQRTASGNLGSLGNTIGAPGDRTIAQRTDTIERRLDSIGQRLGAIERVLFALARAQGIDPETAD